MNRRHAISLVELLVMMSACTVILTMSVSLIHRVMQADSRARAFLNVERDSLRLSQQFRRDVHQARAATVVDGEADDGLFLRLTISDAESIEYRYRDGSVIRTLAQGDVALSRESFTFPAFAKLDIREADSPSRLVLSLAADPATTPEVDGKQPWNPYSTRVAVQIEAALGHDLRFSSETPPEEQP